MLISIITPTKNRATSYLSDLLSSVDSQHLESSWQLEHIICDDHSVPNERLALEKIVSNAKFETKIIYHPKSYGVAAARNTALRETKGEIIIDIDDDDILPSNSLNIRIKHLLHTQALWSFGNALVVDENMKVIAGEELFEKWDHNNLKQKDLIAALINNKAWFWAGTRTYKREALIRGDDIIAWNEKYKVAEDLDHWIKLTNLIGPPAHLNSFVVYWRKKNQSLGIDSVRSGLMQKSVSSIQSEWNYLLA